LGKDRKIHFLGGQHYLCIGHRCLSDRGKKFYQPADYSNRTEELAKNDHNVVGEKRRSGVVQSLCRVGWDLPAPERLDTPHYV